MSASHPTSTGLTSYQTLPRRTFYATIASLMLGMLLAALDQTIVGTAMPRVIADLGGFDHYTWVVTAYLIASTISIPIVGKLSDLHGRKPYYLAGITLFLAGSALCGAAQDMTQLILFRGFQGIGAGVMQSIAFTVVGDLFPPARRGRIQGVFGSVFGLASIVGPIVGGSITDHLSWRWVFYVNLPLGLVVLAALALAFPNIRPRRTHRGVDYRGAALLVAALVPLLLALTWGGSVYAWTSPEEVALLAVAIAMGALFLWNESRVPEPILPLSLFRNHIVGVSLAIVFLSAIGMFGAILFIPLFIQGVLGGSATTSGNVLTPMMLSFVAGSVVSGQIVARRGRYKLNATVGLALMTVGALLLSTMDVHTGYGAAVGSMVVVGIGLGATMPVFTLAVQNAVPYAQLGVATSATQFFRSIGGSVGAAILGGVLASRFAGALPAHLEATLGPERMSTLSPEVLHAVANPQALFAAGEHGGAGPLGPILAQLGPQGADVAQGLVLAIRLSLAEAIRTTFLVSVGVAALCFALSFLLREVPLRKTNHLETAPTPAAGDGGVATTPRGAAPHEAASARHPSAE